MDLGDVERLVVDLYRRHRLDPSEPESPWRLARLELGPQCFEATTLPGPSHAFKRRGQWQIAIAADLPTEYAAHAVGHELGHALLERHGVNLSPAAEETVCDHIGGAILAPKPAVAAMFERHRFNLRRWASLSASTPTWAALRIGEALAIPCAVIGPHKTRLRVADAPPRPGVRRALGQGRTAVFSAA